MFKYLVTTNDPQWIFSTTAILINCSCFIFIVVSYLAIFFKTRNSARCVRKRSKSQMTLQAKITAIIVTDFCCWIPLSAVSLLHLFEVVDASPWYPFFSILILPINSVINPILYDSWLLELLGRLIR